MDRTGTVGQKEKDERKGGIPRNGGSGRGREGSRAQVRTTGGRGGGRGSRFLSSLPLSSSLAPLLYLLLPLSPPTRVVCVCVCVCVCVRVAYYDHIMSLPSVPNRNLHFASPMFDDFNSTMLFPTTVSMVTLDFQGRFDPVFGLSTTVHKTCMHVSYLAIFERHFTSRLLFKFLTAKTTTTTNDFYSEKEKLMRFIVFVLRPRSL